MNFSLGLSLAVLILGALLYIFSNGKGAQLGLVAFAAGLVVFLLQAVGSVSLAAHVH